MGQADCLLPSGQRETSTGLQAALPVVENIERPLCHHFYCSSARFSGGRFLPQGGLYAWHFVTAPYRISANGRPIV